MTTSSDSITLCVYMRSVRDSELARSVDGRTLVSFKSKLSVYSLLTDADMGILTQYYTTRRAAEGPPLTENGDENVNKRTLSLFGVIFISTQM